MAITKARKEKLVAEYLELFKKSQALFLTDYRGLPMSGMSALRAKVRDGGGEYHIAKNTLAMRALKEAGLPAPDDLLAGPTAVGFALNDVPGVAKALVDFSRESEFLKIKGGLMGNRMLTSAEVEALAALPPLPVVRAQLIGLISAPASRLAGLTAASVRQVVNVLKAYSEKAEAAPA